MVESNRIEFKQLVTDDLEKEVVAFLNSKEGGVIYCGIDKSGKVVGLDNIDSEQLKIKDRLKNNILPSCLGLFDLVVEGKSSVQWLKVIVASGPEKPYYIRKYGMSEKGCFIRIGSASEPMTTRMINDLFAKRFKNTIGKTISPKQDLRFEQLMIYYQENGKTLNERFASNLELLDENGNFNYAAYLLNDVNNISMKVARYKGTSRANLIESMECGYCSLVKAAFRILDKTEIENRKSSEITSRKRVDKSAWNGIALREAIINAIVHNDFSNEVPPKFEFFDDRFEISSSGGLPEGLSEDEFFNGYSVPRNKELMRVFKDLQLVEQLGSGIPRILENYGRECFLFSENHIRMIFPIHPDFATATSNKNVTDNVTGNDIGNDTGNDTRSDTRNLNKQTPNSKSNSGKRELLIIEMISKNPQYTAAEMALKIGVARITVIRQLGQMKKKGLIIHKGATKGGYWQILNPDKP
jgi:predicted HTH transcriptional regulator